MNSRKKAQSELGTRAEEALRDLQNQNADEHAEQDFNRQVMARAHAALEEDRFQRPSLVSLFSEAFWELLRAVGSIFEKGKRR